MKATLNFSFAVIVSVFIVVTCGQKLESLAAEKWDATYDSYEIEAYDEYDSQEVEVYLDEVTGRLASESKYSDEESWEKLEQKPIDNNQNGSTVNDSTIFNNITIKSSAYTSTQQPEYSEDAKTEKELPHEALSTDTDSSNKQGQDDGAKSKIITDDYVPGGLESAVDEDSYIDILIEGIDETKADNRDSASASEEPNSESKDKQKIKGWMNPRYYLATDRLKHSNSLFTGIIIGFVALTIATIIFALYRGFVVLSATWKRNSSPGRYSRMAEEGDLSPTLFQDKSNQCA